MATRPTTCVSGSRFRRSFWINQGGGHEATDREALSDIFSAGQSSPAVSRRHEQLPLSCRKQQFETAHAPIVTPTVLSIPMHVQIPAAVPHDQAPGDFAVPGRLPLQEANDHAPSNVNRANMPQRRDDRDTVVVILVMESIRIGTCGLRPPRCPRIPPGGSRRRSAPGAGPATPVGPSHRHRRDAFPATARTRRRS